ncbi:hypothetical protein P7C70_g5499, partial [Phenoliferia sp. Uapishka_3]
MSEKRVQHHAEDEAQAYRLQVIGAREGAIKGTLVAGTLMILANWRYPLVRRQTLAGKCFLVMWGTIFGLVTHADKYLLKWEEEHRIASERWRNVARAEPVLTCAFVLKTELAATGSVPSETTMRKWKEKKDAEARAMDDVPAASPVLDELKRVQEAKESSTTQ